MMRIVVTMPQPTSCRLALISNVPSSFILRPIRLASGNAPNMPFLCAPAATPTPRRMRPRPAGRARRMAQSKATDAALEALAHARVAERQAGDEVGVEGLDHVLEAELDRVEPQRGRHPVHVDLRGRRHLRGAPPASGAPDRRVGEHGAALVLVVRHPVDLGDLLAHVDGVVRRARRVGAGVQRGRGLEVEQVTLESTGGADSRGGGRPDHGRHHALLAVEEELHGTAGGVRQEGAHGLDDVLGLAPERPAHGHLDDAQAVVLHVEKLRDDGPRCVHTLARGPDGHAAGAVTLGDADVRLQGRVMHARRGGGRRHDQRALEIRTRALVDLVLVDDVADRVDGECVRGPARRRS